MTGLFISSNVINLKCIEPRQLKKLHKWYNRTEEYSYATGFDKPVTFEEIGLKYFEALRSNNDIILGIHEAAANTMIGVLKCRLSNDIIWIYSIIVDCDYQNNGYGTKAISLLLKHFKDHNGIKDAFISVADENLKGKSFWMKNGFIEVMPLKSVDLMKRKDCRVIIMKKTL